MAYNKEQLEQKILKVIEKEELTFFNEISLFVDASRATLYNLELDKLDSIKEKLEGNRIKHKSTMRNKWRESENPTLQIAAFKLLSEPEELEKLTTSKVDASVKGTLIVNWDEKKNYGADNKTNEGS